MSALIARWGAPVTYVGAVVLIGLTLITVLARSPDTKLNTRDSAEDYERTALATIGEQESFAGFGAELGSDPASIYLRAGCASCHGLNGRGGAVGPAIWKTNAEDLLDAIREGDRGMPAFPSHRLTDEQAAALSEYLNAQRVVQEQNEAPAAAR